MTKLPKATPRENPWFKWRDKKRDPRKALAA